MAPANEDPIQAFWNYWSEHRADIEDAIEKGTLASWAEGLAERVAAIDPTLDWEMGAGKEAAHYFCVSAKGDPVLRVTAERWRARGPADDEVFEFHASRPGGKYRPQTSLELAGQAFDQGGFQVAFETDDMRERVHVKLFHPQYASAPEDIAALATYISLDNVFGEDDVERFVGGVEISDAPIPDAANLGHLAEAIDAIRKVATGERFALLRGELPDGKPVFITANLAVKRVDNLLMNMHVEATFPLNDPTPEGLTTDEEADQLNVLEDELCESLGHDAVYIARETYGGKRVVHFHAAAEGPVLSRINTFCEAVEDREVEIESKIDPSWEILRRW